MYKVPKLESPFYFISIYFNRTHPIFGGQIRLVPIIYSEIHLFVEILLKNKRYYSNFCTIYIFKQNKNTEIQNSKKKKIKIRRMEIQAIESSFRKLLQWIMRN